MTGEGDTERADILAMLTEFMSSGSGMDTPMAVELMARAGEGDSQQNWSFDAYPVGAARDRSQLLLRRNGQSAATESNRETEFRLLEVLNKAGLPVPKPFWLDANGDHFGRPAFIMERCRGRADLNILLDNNALGLNVEARRDLAADMTDLMADIHALDWRSLGIGDILKVPHTSAAETRLTMIIEEIERWRVEPMPELVEVIDWLRSNMPKPRELVLTHGEFRTVQALVDDEGKLVTMLDWEFARITDPLDELAYFHNPTATYFHTIPGVWGEDEFLAQYERKSGMTVDRRELHWWKTLNMLWVMGFVSQAVVGILSGQNDSVRTGIFNGRLIALLQNLLDQGQSVEA